MQGSERAYQQQEVQKAQPPTPELPPPNMHETGLVFSSSVSTTFLTALQEASHPGAARPGLTFWASRLGRSSLHRSDRAGHACVQGTWVWGGQPGVQRC